MNILPPIACSLREAAQALKGQHLQPGKAGSAVFPVGTRSLFT